MNILLLYKEKFTGTYGPFINYLAKKNKIVWISGTNDKTHLNIRNLKTYNIFHKEAKFRISLCRVPYNAIHTASYLLRKISSFNKIKEIVNSEKIDIVVAVDKLPDVVIGYLLSRIKKIPFVYRFDFPIYESYIYQFKMGKWYWLLRAAYSKLAILIRDSFIKKADLVLPISNKSKEYVLNLGVPASRIEIISSCANMCNHNNSKKKEYDLIYIGTQDNSRKLDALLVAVNKAKQKIPHIKLIMIGKPNPSLIKIAKKMGLHQNVIFKKEVRQNEVCGWIQKTKIGLAIIPPNNIFNMASPLKFVEYLACGKPVIATKIPEQEEVINKHKCGICVAYDDQKIADAVIHLIENPMLANKMGDNGKKFVAEFRTFQVLGKKIEKKLKSLIKK
jgi:glycosyltransferase involved in cell wall biosynthesis